ncbi:MAG: hypothetical protein LUE87_04175, partial [Lachnospiraceae bacterium]|nr:hypothetical protein [Lachnospiraceae bacterium]
MYFFSHYIGDIRRIKTAVFGILLAVGLWAGQVSARAGEPQTISKSDLFSQAAVLMDASTGRVLYGKNEDTVLAMARNTKILT